MSLLTRRSFQFLAFPEIEETPALDLTESPEVTESPEATESPEVTVATICTKSTGLREAMKHLDFKATVLRNIPIKRTSQFGQTQTIVNMDDGTDRRMLIHAPGLRTLRMPAALLTVRRIPFHPSGLRTLVRLAALLTKATNHGQQGKVVTMDI